MALEKDFRAPNSPSPIYGIRPGFTVGDLDKSYLFSGISSSTQLSAIASTSSSVSNPTAISPNARVVKVIINVTAGSGSVDVVLKSASDSYSTSILDTGKLSLGTYEFYVGGWSSPTSNSDATYLATKYGPVKSGSSPEASNTTGNEETTNPDPSASNNYIGGTYNPVDFISLAGAQVKVYATVTGTVTYDVEVTPVS